MRFGAAAHRRAQLEVHVVPELFDVAVGVPVPGAARNLRAAGAVSRAAPPGRQASAGRRGGTSSSCSRGPSFCRNTSTFLVCAASSSGSMSGLLDHPHSKSHRCPLSSPGRGVLELAQGPGRATAPEAFEVAVERIVKLGDRKRREPLEVVKVKLVKVVVRRLLGGG